MRFLLTIVSKAIHAGTWGAAKNSHALPLLPPPLVAELFSLWSAAIGQNLSVSGIAEKAMKLLSFCTVIPSVVVGAWLPTTADAQTQEPAPGVGDGYHPESSSPLGCAGPDSEDPSKVD